VAATRRFFDLLSDEEVDVLTAVFDRVLANVDRGTGDEVGPGRDLLEVAQGGHDQAGDGVSRLVILMTRSEFKPRRSA
jgi:hypothetical protein